MSEQEREPRDGEGTPPGTPPGPPPSSSSAPGDGPELDVDTAFAAIVASWSTETDDAGSWPDQENLSVPRHRRADDPSPLTDPAERGTERGTDSRGSDLFDRPPAPGRAEGDPPVEAPSGPDLFVERTTGPRDFSPRHDPDEDRFVPPDPGPLPRGDWISVLSWAGALGGPLFLLVAVLVWRAETPSMLVFAAVAAFVAGFVALVVRMPRDRDDTDGDDGAVV